MLRWSDLIGQLENLIYWRQHPERKLDISECNYTVIISLIWLFHTTVDGTEGTALEGPSSISGSRRFSISRHINTLPTLDEQTKKMWILWTIREPRRPTHLLLWLLELCLCESSMIVWLVALLSAPAITYQKIHEISNIEDCKNTVILWAQFIHVFGSRWILPVVESTWIGGSRLALSYYTRHTNLSPSRSITESKPPFNTANSLSRLARVNRKITVSKIAAPDQARARST